MAEINGSLQQTHRLLESLFAALDPISLILSQNSNSNRINTLRLTTENFIMERGPRYRAYADLRESKLRMKNMKQLQQQSEEPELKLLTISPKKQVKFQGNSPLPTAGRKGPSVLAQSVPDFSVALRKENRKPPTTTLPSMLEMTPPSKNYSRVNGVVSKLRGSKSASAGEKKGGGFVTRKSYASVEELKGMSSTVATAINGENRGGRRSGRGIGKTVLGYNRQF